MIYALANTNLHFSDEQFKVIDISENLLMDNLKLINNLDFDNIDGLMVFAEAKTKDGLHQNYEGLELLKHTLLNQQKQYFNIPVLVIHVLKLDYVLRRDNDNLVLLSSNIKTISLEDFAELSSKQLTDSYFCKNEVKLISQKEFSNYVIIDKTDESATHHDEINAAGANRMRKEWDANYSNLEEPLHFKKYFFKHDIKISSLDSKDIHEFATCRDSLNKVLFIDDEAEKWTPTLQAILGAGKLDVHSSFKSAQNEIKNLHRKLNKQSSKLKNSRPSNQSFSINLKEAPLHPSGSFRQPKDKTNYDIASDCREIWPYDVVILDLRDKSSSEYLGLALIKKIQAVNPITPIIVFSATKNIETVNELRKLGIKYFFTKGKQSIKDLIDIFWEIDIVSNVKLYDVWWKIYVLEKYVIETKQHAVFYNFNISDNPSLDFYAVNHKYKSDFQKAVRLVLLSLKNIITNLFKFSDDLKRSYNLTDRTTLDGLIALYPFFTSSELRFKTLPTENEINLNFKNPFIYFNESRLIRDEREFRKIRNHLFHPELELETYQVQRLDIVEEVEFFLDWLIDPMQLDVVQDLVRELAKVYGIKYEK